MNGTEQEDPSIQVADHDASPALAEFRRWLIVAFFFAVLGGCLEVIAMKLRGTNGAFIPNSLFIAFWVCFTAVEGWIRFHGVVRRLCWPASGALAVGFLLAYTSGSRLETIVVFIIPAVLEFLVAREVRERPWIWLIVTPLLYGTIHRWTYLVSNATRKLMAHLSSAFDFPLPIQSNIAALAACFAVILIVRAVTGSFIASRKVS